MGHGLFLIEQIQISHFAFLAFPCLHIFPFCLIVSCLTGDAFLLCTGGLLITPSSVSDASFQASLFLFPELIYEEYFFSLHIFYKLTFILSESSFLYLLCNFKFPFMDFVVAKVRCIYIFRYSISLVI